MPENEDHTDAAQRVVRRWHADLSNKFWRVTPLCCAAGPCLFSHPISPTLMSTRILCNVHACAVLEEGDAPPQPQTSQPLSWRLRGLCFISKITSQLSSNQ